MHFRALPLFCVACFDALLIASGRLDRANTITLWICMILLLAGVAVILGQRWLPLYLRRQRNAMTSRPAGDCEARGEIPEDARREPPL